MEELIDQKPGVNPAPNNKFIAYLVSLFLVLFVFLVLGSIPLLVHLVLKIGGPEALDDLSTGKMMDVLGKNIFLVHMLTPFVLGCLTLFICQKFIIKKPVKLLFTKRKAFDFSRFFSIFFLWLFIQLAFILIHYFQSDTLIWNFQFEQFLGLLLICIIVVPFQIGFEELFFRGFLIDFFRLFTQNKWILVVLSGVLFGLMHAGNPEIDMLGQMLLFYYIGLGIFMGILAVFDKGLELSLGFHYANNLIPFLIVTNDWQAINTDALFIDIAEPALAWSDWISLALILPAIIFIYKRIYKWNMNG